MLIGKLRRSPLLKGAALALTLAVVGMVAACGSTTNEGVGGGPPARITCSQAAMGHGVDVVNTKLTCQVSGATSSATSFQLHFAITNGTGNQRNFDATCDGKLQNGAGTCTQTYALVVPMDMGAASVSGEFLPSHQAIGPVALPTPGN